MALLGEFDQARLVGFGAGMTAAGNHRGDGGQEWLCTDEAGVDLCGVLRQWIRSRAQVQLARLAGKGAPAEDGAWTC
ncbi:hypothetical protein [Streptomyces sp. NPDC056628]|uniref:hypothetical protein n=1 Tax=Streptomyces sp. NPDC056628 TaxID=3345882 RepID=UPI0036988B38